MKFVLLTIGTVACSIVENCDMIRDGLKTSIDKQDYSCKQNGMKSKICQAYIHEVQANKAALKKCNAEKAEPAFKKPAVPAENRCEMLRNDLKGQEDKRDMVCKKDGWKTNDCQIYQKVVVTVENLIKECSWKTAPPPSKIVPYTCNPEQQRFHNMHNLEFGMDEGFCPDWNACKQRMHNINTGQLKGMENMWTTDYEKLEQDRDFKKIHNNLWSIQAHHCILDNIPEKQNFTRAERCNMAHNIFFQTNKQLKMKDCFNEKSKMCDNLFEKKANMDAQIKKNQCNAKKAAPVFKKPAVPAENTCEMQRESLIDSERKRTYACKQNRGTSEVCQTYQTEIDKNWAALKACNAKKAEAAAEKGGYLEENCVEQMAGYNTCKRQYWKSKSCQIRQKEIEVKANQAVLHECFEQAIKKPAFKPVAEDCAMLRKETSEQRMAVDQSCQNTNMMLCQLSRNALFAAEKRQKMSGCDGKQAFKNPAMPAENRCDMLRDDFKGSEDKRDQVCKMDGWKSLQCQINSKVVQAQADNLRNSGCDGKPAFKPVAEDCAMLSKVTSEQKIQSVKDCQNGNTFACQIRRKAFFAAEEKQKMSGCDGKQAFKKPAMPAENSCEMQQESLKTSQLKKHLDCEIHGLKSNSCQMEQKMVQAQADNLRNSGCDKKIAEQCVVLRKSIQYHAMQLKRDCPFGKAITVVCQALIKDQGADAERLKMLGCDGGDFVEEHNQGMRIHSDSVAWAVTTCVLVGAVGIVVAKKVQAFNQDQGIHEAFIDNEQA